MSQNAVSHRSESTSRVVESMLSVAEPERPVSPLPLEDEDYPQWPVREDEKKRLMRSFGCSEGYHTSVWSAILRRGDPRLKFSLSTPMYTSLTGSALVKICMCSGVNVVRMDTVGDSQAYRPIGNVTKRKRMLQGDWARHYDALKHTRGHFVDEGDQVAYHVVDEFNTMDGKYQQAGNEPAFVIARRHAEPVEQEYFLECVNAYIPDFAVADVDVAWMQKHKAKEGKRKRKMNMDTM